MKPKHDDPVCANCRYWGTGPTKQKGFMAPCYHPEHSGRMSTTRGTEFTSDRWTTDRTSCGGFDGSDDDG